MAKVVGYEFLCKHEPKKAAYAQHVAPFNREQLPTPWTTSWPLTTDVDGRTGIKSSWQYWLNEYISGTYIATFMDYGFGPSGIPTNPFYVTGVPIDTSSDVWTFKITVYLWHEQSSWIERKYSQSGVNNVPQFPIRDAILCNAIRNGSGWSFTTVGSVPIEASVSTVQNESWIDSPGLFTTVVPWGNELYKVYSLPSSSNQQGDAMPWLSILTFLLSFLTSKKKGMSTGAALLTGAAVSAATYYLADPSNPDNLFKIGQSTEASTAGAKPLTNPPPTDPRSTTWLQTAGDLAGKTISTTGDVLKSWGPTGTSLVLGTSAAVSSKNWMLLAALAVGAFILLK